MVTKLIIDNYSLTLKKGSSINIPTLLIGKTSGATITKYIEDNPDAAGSIIVVATFPLVINIY